MARELDKLGVAIRLAEDHGRVLSQYTSIHDDLQRTVERMRDIVDPPVLRGMHERFSAMNTTPRLAAFSEPHTKQWGSLSELIAVRLLV